MSAQPYTRSSIGCHAYIDDTGDVGTRGGSKNHFALGGYFVRPEDEVGVREALAQARAEFGFPAGRVLHFRDLGHERRVRLAEIIAVAPITGLTAVLCKKAGPEKRPWQPEHLYNWTLKLVLERASWFFRDMGVRGSITFAHLKGHQVDKTHAYIERLKQADTQIDWRSVHLPVRFSTPQEDERLQPADTICSSVGQAFQEGNHNICEPRYLRVLAPILWRRQGTLMSYGLKIHPLRTAEPICPTPHEWLDQDPL